MAENNVSKTIERINSKTDCDNSLTFYSLNRPETKLLSERKQTTPFLSEKSLCAGPFFHFHSPCDDDERVWTLEKIRNGAGMMRKKKKKKIHQMMMEI